MNIKTLIRKNILSFLIVPILLSFLASCSSEANESGVKDKKPSTQPSTYPGRPSTIAILNTEEDVKRRKEMDEMESFKKIDAQWDQIDKAGYYEDRKDYDRAIVEYKKAIELAPYEEDEGVPRRGLARIYETTNQYELALEQIDWLMNGQTRQDVLDELLTRKQKLEQLLKEQ